MQDFLIRGNDFLLDLKGEEKKTVLPLKKYVEQLCLIYGSTYEGRRKAFGYLLKKDRKLPLVISDLHLKYYLLTRSLKSSDALLINYNKLYYYETFEMNTKLYFKDNISYLLKEDYRIIKRQCLLFEEYFKIRKQHQAYEEIDLF